MSKDNSVREIVLEELMIPESFILFVKRCMESFKCSAHDENHVFRVAHLSLAIGTELEPRANLKIVYLASMCHDILDSKLVSEEDASNNETSLRRELASFSTEEEINHIIDIVKSVGYKNMLSESWDPMAHSPEYRCVQDADLLDAIGCIGIGRCFSFGGRLNRDLFGVNDDNKECTREEYLLNQPRGDYVGINVGRSKDLSGIQHFFDKLLRIKSLMITSKGKEMAQRKQDNMIIYLHALAEELIESGSEDGDILRRKLQYFVAVKEKMSWK